MLNAFIFEKASEQNIINVTDALGRLIKYYKCHRQIRSPNRKARNVTNNIDPHCNNFISDILGVS